ncbi:11070_t:CDS:2 [Funneliformis caledonium]|uniref:11070_t:CDS:1 n=1 Tax=Funneliformis caledonium TaxID=1117310 RepID=A0A9N9FGC7_9GLOM|nr:11070_t:CDS:2 [Funneliformis caledonium]
MDSTNLPIKEFLEVLFAAKANASAALAAILLMNFNEGKAKEFSSLTNKEH